MTATSNPQTAAEQARKNYRDVTIQLGHLGLDTSVPETVRAIAEKSVAQTRELYDRSKDALDASIVLFEKTFDAAGQGAAVFNRKIIDLGRRNVNSVIRPCQELSPGQEPLRHRAGASGLLAETGQCADRPSRRSPCAVDQGGGRRGRAHQGCAWMSCARQTEWLEREVRHGPVLIKTSPI